MLRALFEIPLNNFPGVRLESLCYLGGRARPRLPALGKGRPANALERLGLGPAHFLIRANMSFSQHNICRSDLSLVELRGRRQPPYWWTLVDAGLLLSGH